MMSTTFKVRRYPKPVDGNLYWVQDTVWGIGSGFVEAFPTEALAVACADHLNDDAIIPEDSSDDIWD